MRDWYGLSPLLFNVAAISATYLATVAVYFALRRSVDIAGAGPAGRVATRDVCLARSPDPLAGAVLWRTRGQCRLVVSEPVGCWGFSRQVHAAQLWVCLSGTVAGECGRRGWRLA